MVFKPNVTSSKDGNIKYVWYALPLQGLKGSNLKEKIITIKPKNITQKQWVNFILELNLMKKAWKPYGVDVEIKAPGIKKTILWGNKVGGQDIRTDLIKPQDWNVPKMKSIKNFGMI